MHKLAQAKAHSKALVIGGICVIVVTSAVTWHMTQSRVRPLRASRALSQARTPEALMQVAAQYPRTLSGSAAYMFLGQMAAQQTNYTQAIQYYSVVAYDMPESMLQPLAKHAIAQCYMAQRDYDRAITLLRRDVLYDMTSYVAPLAWLDLVYALTAVGRYQEAWNELAQWEQQAAGMHMRSAADGLREMLLRVTGVSTNHMAQQHHATSHL